MIDSTSARVGEGQIGPAERPPVVPRVVDASMTLLNEVMHHPLDPGYAAAARRRADDPAPWRGRIASVLFLLVLTIAGGWVVTNAVVELRRPAPEAVQARARLERQITERIDARNRARKKVAADEAKAAQLQSEALSRSGNTALQDQLNQLAGRTGGQALTGPGLQISLTDAKVGSSGQGQLNPRAQTQPSDGKVLDRDVQITVNGLWAAGATAISINGQRLTALSAIRAAGEAILVDFQPLSPPYVIKALGNPDTLQTGFAGDLAGPYLKGISSNYHVGVDISPEKSMHLPAASSLKLQYARVFVPEVEATSGAGPDSSTSPVTAPASSPASGATAPLSSASATHTTGGLS